jgi:hypothetical protein
MAGRRNRPYLGNRFAAADDDDMLASRHSVEKAAGIVLHVLNADCAHSDIVASL